MMRGSLRARITLLVNLCILVPMTLYLVWETRHLRDTILQSRVEVLSSLGLLVVQDAAVVSEADMPQLQERLGRFGGGPSELHIFLIDHDFRVRAASLPAWVGREVVEDEFAPAFAGERDLAWDLDAHDDTPVLEVTMPAPPLGLVHITEPQATLERESRRAVVRHALFVLALMVAMSGAVTAITHRVVIRRIQRLRDWLDRTPWHAARSEPDEPRDELEALADALETMLAAIDRTTTDLRRTLDEKQVLVEQVEGFNEQLTAEVEATRHEIEAMQEELLRKERLSVVGELAAGLAHEIRNPLQIIQGTVEMARRNHPRAAEELDDVVGEVRRLNQLVRDLLDYARPLNVERRTVAVVELLQRSLAEVGLPREGVDMTLDVSAECRCVVDPPLLQRVLVNVLSNALEAVPDGRGRMIITAAWDASGDVVIEVQDNGGGLAEQDLPRIFTPFFSRKEAGIGLGLCLSRRIVERHGGTLELHNATGGGALARIELPAEEGER